MTPRLREHSVVEQNTDTRRFANLFSKAFLAAYLLTGSALQAEDSVKNAIDRWDPDTQDEDQLFQATLRMALQKQVKASSLEQQKHIADILLPAELRQVLELPAKLRHCFVLRVLIGLSLPTCARILHLSADEIDRHSCRAIESLCACHSLSDGGEETC